MKGMPFRTEFIPKLMDGTKTQHRVPIKYDLMYSLVGDRIDLVRNGGDYYEKTANTETYSGFTERRLPSGLRWADLFTEEIHWLWEKGFRGVALLKRPPIKSRKRIPSCVLVPQQQKGIKDCTPHGLYGVSWNAREARLASTALGRRYRKQPPRKPLLGNTIRQLARQDSSWSWDKRRKALGIKAKEYRACSPPMGSQGRLMLPETRWQSLEDEPTVNIRDLSLEVGSRVFVKESWYAYGIEDRVYCTYKSDNSFRKLTTVCNDHENPLPKPEDNPKGKWKSPATMPQWAARTFLEITAVRVERVNSITHEDSMAEGIVWDGKWFLGALHEKKGTPKVYTFANQAFESFWRDIYGKDAWERNDWVFVYGLKRVEDMK